MCSTLSWFPDTMLHRCQFLQLNWLWQCANYDVCSCTSLHDLSTAKAPEHPSNPMQNTLGCFHWWCVKACSSFLISISWSSDPHLARFKGWAQCFVWRAHHCSCNLPQIQTSAPLALMANSLMLVRFDSSMIWMMCSYFLQWSPALLFVFPALLQPWRLLVPIARSMFQKHLTESPTLTTMPFFRFIRVRQV